MKDNHHNINIHESQNDNIYQNAFEMEQEVKKLSGPASLQSITLYDKIHYIHYFVSNPSDEERSM